MLLFQYDGWSGWKKILECLEVGVYVSHKSMSDALGELRNRTPLCTCACFNKTFIYIKHLSNTIVYICQNKSFAMGPLTFINLMETPLNIIKSHYTS